MATEEITISELELAENVLDDMVTPVETSTETKAITLKQLRKYLGSSLPTGFIIPAVGKIDDSRFTLLDGKIFSRMGTYKDFCDKVIERVQNNEWFACTEAEFSADVTNYGQCGRFVIGNDYIRIPKITRFLGATITLSEIGKTYRESLPNIKGTLGGNVAAGFAGNTGAFTSAISSSNVSVVSTPSTVNAHGFDASRSSSTYQNNAKVQPDHTKYMYYMVVSTEGQQEEVTVDINQVYEDMNLKVNKSGDEEISGTKTFNNVINSKANGTIIQRDFGAGNYATKRMLIFNGDTLCGMTAVKNSVEAYFDVISTGNSTRCQASSGVIETIAGWNIVGISKSQNGYVKFRNGIIIQWGWNSGSGSTLTFPTPFTSLNYSVTANYRKQGSSGSGIGHVVFYPTSTTNCYFNSQGGDFQWIAIGY